MSGWYESAFGADYLDICRDFLAQQAPLELRFLRKRLPVAPPARLLDLCCGHGRHSIPLAKRGFQVTGLDFQETYLEEARRAAEDAGVCVSFVQGDMRELPFPENSFDAVIHMYGSFGYFTDEEENREVLRQAFRVLAPGGCHLVDVLSADWYSSIAHQTMTFEVAGETVHEENRFDSETRRSEVAHRFLDSKTGETLRTNHYSIRLYSSSEMSEELAAAGFEVLQQWGNFVGSPASPRFNRLISLARKPG